MKTFSELATGLDEDKDWTKHPQFGRGPFGKGTSSNPHFPTMSDNSLKLWINTRMKNAGAHELSPLRAKQLTKASAEHNRRKGIITEGTLHRNYAVNFDNGKGARFTKAFKASGGHGYERDLYPTAEKWANEHPEHSKHGPWKVTTDKPIS